MKKHVLLGLCLLVVSSLGAQTLIKDLNPGGSGIAVEDCIVFNNQVFFTSYSSSTGYELGVTDGASSNTFIIDIVLGPNGSYPHSYFVFNNELFFSAETAASGRELWKTDGTALGTQIVKDIRFGPNSSEPLELIEISNQLLFVANDGINGRELWVSDGTASGTLLFKNMAMGPASSNPHNLTVANSKLYFAANASSSGVELYISDGTPVNTKQLKDLNTGTKSSFPQRFLAFGDSVVFAAQTSTQGQEIWISDGTSSGTSMLSNLYPGSGSSTPESFHLLKNEIFFAASDSVHGRELFKIDRGSLNVSLVKDLVSGTQSSSPTEITVAKDYLFFAANDGSSDKEPYYSDGSSTNTQRLLNIHPSASSNPSHFLTLDNHVYFAADDGSHGIELWHCLPTAAQAQIVKDVNTGSSSSSPYFLQSVGDSIFFFADDGLLGDEPYLIKHSNCSPFNGIATDSGTYVSKYSTTDDSGWSHYCDCNDQLLMSFNFNNSGYELADTAVQIKITDPRTTSYNQDTGLIANPDGGVILNRRWSISTLNQPPSNVGVRYYFPDDEMVELKNEALLLDEPTTVTSVYDIEMFYIFQGNYGAFENESQIASSDAYILVNGSNTNSGFWMEDSVSDDYNTAEFWTNALIGGGAGVGAANMELPVELTYFSGLVLGLDGHILWQTALENNVERYIIERSSDLSNWNSIGSVLAAGHSSEILDYSFIDYEAGQVTSKLYYRLITVNSNGTKEYSEPIELVFQATLQTVTLFPNPSNSGYLNIKTNRKKQKVEIIGADGRLMEGFQLNQSHALDTKAYPSGIYFMVGSNFSEKFIIQ